MKYVIIYPHQNWSFHKGCNSNIKVSCNCFKMHSYIYIYIYIHIYIYMCIYMCWKITFNYLKTNNLDQLVADIIIFILDGLFRMDLIKYNFSSEQRPAKIASDFRKKTQWTTKRSTAHKVSQPEKTDKASEKAFETDVHPWFTHLLWARAALSVFETVFTGTDSRDSVNGWTSRHGELKLSARLDMLTDTSGWPCSCFSNTLQHSADTEQNKRQYQPTLNRLTANMVLFVF